MTSHLHPSNSIGVRNFAEQHGQRDLVTHADDFILENFVDVVVGDEFTSMTARCLETIVASDNLNVRSEIQVSYHQVC